MLGLYFYYFLRMKGRHNLTFYLISHLVADSDLEIIKLEYNLRLEIKRNDWLLADTCPQATNHCALF